MKKVYYLAHCGSGTSVHYKLINLVKEEGNKMLFHIEDFDWDKKGYPKRIITLKGYKRIRKNFNNDPYETIDFNSSKEQYKYHFIVEKLINDNEEPKESFIRI